MPSSESLSLKIQPRGKPIRLLPKEINAENTADLYDQLSRATSLSPYRLRVTKASDGTLLPYQPSVSLRSTGLAANSSIAVKDLGPQLGWRTVYVVEYLGPLLIHPALCLLPALRSLAYWYAPAAGAQATSWAQQLAMALITLHFVKRELETLFVHRFSAATMPAFNIFKNSAHYWLLAGLNIAYWTYAPSAAAAAVGDWTPLLALGTALFAVGELGNLYAHLVLRSLRATGTKTRGVPQGWMFRLVTCPNYMFEGIAWAGLCAVTMSWSTVLFTVVGVAQMAVWAKKREMRYRKEFDHYKKKRYCMIPGVF
jgi:very-long-chain enoyl-CoA reductase